MKIGEPKFETKQPTEFRTLVEDLLKDSKLLEDWINPREGSNEKMSVIDAIEKNELPFYAGNYRSDRELDAINCLTAIYDELKKSDPNNNFIEETVAQLREYL